MRVRLIRCDGIYAAILGASKCYDSDHTTDVGLLTECYESGHESVLEHITLSFEVSGVSRALLAQLTRHRLMSFTVRSQRYCDEDKADCVVPQTVLQNENAYGLYSAFMNLSFKTYRSLIEMGIPREDARFVLTNACETQLVVTMNLRELIHFCNERMCSKAQWEIRALANEMAVTVGTAYPFMKKMLVPKCEARGIVPMCKERRSCGKHKTEREVARLLD